MRATPQNPFKPTAGKTPPELIGRDGAVELFREGLENGAGAPGRLLRVTGARGTGKTVMLGEFRRIVGEAMSRWAVVSETASPGFAGRVLEALSDRGVLSSVRIQPSAFGVSLGSLEIERASLGLTEAMMSATARGRGLLITLDEVQDAALEETRALAIAVQNVIGEDRDIALAIAGLPTAIDGVVDGEALTFLRRAEPVELGPIPVDVVAESYADTMGRGDGMEIGRDLVERMASASAGYPFMVQLVGYQVWQTAFRRNGRRTGSVTASDVETGVAEARRRFDAMVVEPALHRLPPSAMAFLGEMARRGDGPVRTSEVAEGLGKPASSLSPVRARLLREGIVEAPSRGRLRLAIPYMADYLRELAALSFS